MRPLGKMVAPSGAIWQNCSLAGGVINTDGADGWPATQKGSADRYRQRLLIMYERLIVCANVRHKIAVKKQIKIFANYLFSHTFESISLISHIDCPAA
jgi:hypothetical protein